MMNMIVFLQNAWSPVYAGKVWPRRSWLRALARSRSGTRLRVMIDDLSVCHNAAPLTGATPNSVIQPDIAHIRELLRFHDPKVVVACGKHAETALRVSWNGPLLCVPHPSHRYLTNELYARARESLEDGFAEQFALRQLRHGVTVETFR